MKAFELLKLNQSLLATMNSHSIAIGDVKHLGMLDDYMRMMGEGDKKTYIIQVLSDKYDIAERTLYRVIERLTQDVALQ